MSSANECSEAIHQSVAVEERVYRPHQIGGGYLLAQLRTATPVDNHAGQDAVDDVVVLVEVQHRDAGHAPRRTARARVDRVRLLRQMRVRVLLQKHVRTLSRAVVRFVSLRRDDPVPAELLEVDRQRVPTATRFVRVLFAVQADHSTLAMLRFRFHLNLDE